MTRPGDQLRAWASRFISAGTMARVVDPAVADLQLEYTPVQISSLISERGRASCV